MLVILLYGGDKSLIKSHDVVAGKPSGLGSRIGYLCFQHNFIAVFPAPNRFGFAVTADKPLDISVHIAPGKALLLAHRPGDLLPEIIRNDVLRPEKTADQSYTDLLRLGDDPVEKSPPIFFVVELFFHNFFRVSGVYGHADTFDAVFRQRFEAVDTFGISVQRVVKKPQIINPYPEKFLPVPH